MAYLRLGCLLLLYVSCCLDVQSLSGAADGSRWQSQASCTRETFAKSFPPWPAVTWQAGGSITGPRMHPQLMPCSKRLASTVQLLKRGTWTQMAQCTRLLQQMNAYIAAVFGSPESPPHRQCPGTAQALQQCPWNPGQNGLTVARLCLQSHCTQEDQLSLQLCCKQHTSRKSAARQAITLWHLVWPHVAWLTMYGGL